MPHGMVYGDKPNKVSMLTAQRLEAFMGKRTRISTTISGTIIKVLKPKGGWFDVDAGNGKVIAAHFKNYNVMLPSALKGRHVIVEGVAQKQFTPLDTKKWRQKASRDKKIVFEVKGLMID